MSSSPVASQGTTKGTAVSPSKGRDMLLSPMLFVLALAFCSTVRGAGCYCRDANGCVANNGCQCSTSISACTAISGQWAAGCCQPPSSPPPPPDEDMPHGNVTWLAQHSLLCPQDNPALCDNGGACGACFMRAPSAACIYGRSLPECRPDLVGFGQPCDTSGGSAGPRGGYDVIDPNGVHPCGTSLHTNNCAHQSNSGLELLRRSVQ